MRPNDKYWFKAKKYGWGWGLPATWQGWAVVLAYLGLLAFGALVWPAASDGLGFAGWIAVSSVVLIAVCWWKGEPPGWHWGK